MWRVVRSVLVVSLACGVLFTLIGAQTTYRAPTFALRLLHMTVLSLLAGTVGASITVGLEGAAPLAGRRWLRALAAGLAMTLPMGLMFWAADRLLAPARTPTSFLPSYLGAALVFSLFWSILIAALSRERVIVVAPAAAAPPKFLGRLPPRLFGAEVWALEAEDHYLRVHTSKGRELILMRLSDAIAELEGLEGAQTHRSWWVARGAIADAKRGDGRAVLTLKDGTEAPVSRTYAPALREKRWI